MRYPDWERLSGGRAEGTTRWSLPHTTHCLCPQITALFAPDGKSQEHGESYIAGETLRHDFKWILKKKIRRFCKSSKKEITVCKGKAERAAHVWQMVRGWQARDSATVGPAEDDERNVSWWEGPAMFSLSIYTWPSRPGKLTEVNEVWERHDQTCLSQQECWQRMSYGKERLHEEGV